MKIVNLISQAPSNLPTYTLWSLTCHPSLPILVSAGSDRSLRVYALSLSRTSGYGSSSSNDKEEDESTAIQLKHINTLTTSHTKSLRTLAFNHIGDKLAVGSFDSSISIWVKSQDIENGSEWEESEMLEGMENEVKAVRWKSSKIINSDLIDSDEKDAKGDDYGGWIAACGRDKSVWIWEVIPETNEFEVAAVCLDHEQDVKSIAWHPFEDILVSASYDTSMHFYSESPFDAEWTSHQHIPSAHPSTVWTVCFSNDGEFLLSGGDDDEGGGDVRWWFREKVPHISNSIRVGRGEKEKWKFGGIVRQDVEEDQKRGPVVSVQWKGDHVLCAQRDGRIEVFKSTKVGEGKMDFERIDVVEKAHGDFDLNNVIWIDYRPQSPEARERWKDVERCFASCGDDGLVKLWMLAD